MLGHQVAFRKSMDTDISRVHLERQVGFKYAEKNGVSITKYEAQVLRKQKWKRQWNHSEKHSSQLTDRQLHIFSKLTLLFSQPTFSLRTDFHFLSSI